VPLNISQFYGALHQQAQCGDACEVNKNQTRLLATLKTLTECRITALGFDAGKNPPLI
jgi:hypothetical protein